MSISSTRSSTRVSQQAVKYDQSVFINCPFDWDYETLIRALVFAVYFCGLLPRSAAESESSSDDRLEKIINIIGQCKYGIHDLSRMELDPGTTLPRFNMPFELGLFYGALKLGDTQQRDKNCLVIDTEQHRYRKSLSDWSGKDIKPHKNDPGLAIGAVRNWIASQIRKRAIPSGSIIAEKYKIFDEQLPVQCAGLELDPDDLTYNDFCTLVEGWLEKLLEIE